MLSLGFDLPVFLAMIHPMPRSRAAPATAPTAMPAFAPVERELPEDPSTFAVDSLGGAPEAVVPVEPAEVVVEVSASEVGVEEGDEEGEEVVELLVVVVVLLLLDVVGDAAVKFWM